MSLFHVALGTNAAAQRLARRREAEKQPDARRKRAAPLKKVDRRRRKR
jgi:hypothetical protein